MFVRWDRWPIEQPPRRPVPTVVPDLVVEVFSETNTQAEMDDKRQTYLRAGVRLIWYIDPATRSARAFTSEMDVQEVSPGGSLDGGDVLPGLRLSLRAMFEHADRQGPRDS